MLFLILLIVILAVVLFFLLPKPKPPRQKTNNFEAPNSKIGTPIPVLFGTRAIKGPFILWYGDIKIVKVDRPSKGKK